MRILAFALCVTAACAQTPPLDVAKQLEQVYGHTFDSAVYIQAMALIGRIRLGHEADVRRIVAPFAEGQKDSMAKATASHLSGHLVFGELAERTGDKRYVDLVRKAADSGETFHNEMSDSVFMVCPILAKAGKLTKEGRYFDRAVEHFRFMEKLCLRGDGLYRHSPLDEAAWGRGNAFPALGLALTLTDLPKNHSGYSGMLSAYRKLIGSLAKYQDGSGMWRQVVDHPEAYLEFSAAAMIGRAMLIGIRNGWLDKKTYQPKVDAAWKAIAARTSADGTVEGVCESTGKQPNLTAYLQRKAITGKDPRGGAMALLFAVEMADLK